MSEPVYHAAVQRASQPVSYTMMKENDEKLREETGKCADEGE
jgi:hypothetical protein